MIASYIMLWFGGGAGPSAATGCWSACSAIRVLTTDARASVVRLLLSSHRVASATLIQSKDEEL
jgi:hypothetical protein